MSSRPLSRHVDVGLRLLEHVENKTTDSAKGVQTLPVSNYLDPEIWEVEMERIFKRLPLMLAFSCELPEPSTYKALDVVGVPVLIVRGKDGVARAFLNACAHRGARMKAEGAGECRTLVCPYHGWAYGDGGELVGVKEARKFGDIDKSTRGLRALPCEERSGLIFVSLTPGLEFDLEDYLGGMLDELESLGIEDWKVYTRKRLEGANWKACHDGYVDGYHFDTLHPQTVALISLSNVATYDAFGPHQRIGFANVDVLKLRKKPSSEWFQDEGFGFVRTLFPNVSFAVRAGVGGLVSQLFPGPTHDKSVTVQTFLKARLPETDAEKAAADAEVEVFYKAVRDEDYLTVSGVQQGMESGAIKEVVLGRNEIGNQRLHEWIRYYSQERPEESEPPKI